MMQTDSSTTDSTPDPATIETTADPATTDSTRLARFIAVIALDTDRLATFLDRAEPMMEARGLTAEEKDLLSAPAFRDLCTYMYSEATKPLGGGGDPDPDGSGSGSG